MAWDGVVLGFAHFRLALKRLDSRMTRLALREVGFGTKKSPEEGQIEVVGSGDD